MNQPGEVIVRSDSVFGVIVGIGTYQSPQISKLSYTHTDATAFYELLTNPQRIGFPKQNVKLLVDDQATRANMIRSVSTWLRGNVTGEDATVMVFFAGHGGQEEDKTGEEGGKPADYLLPWDADPEDLAATAISNSEFNRMLRMIRAKRTVIFLDACHSGGVAKAGARDVGVAVPNFQRLGEGEGKVVLAAAKPEQRSWEDESISHGIFTYHLLEALNGKADENDDGYVSVREVVDYLQREVPKTVRRLGKESQDPFLICETTSDIVLAVNPGMIAERREARETAQREAREAQLLQERKLFDLHASGALDRDLYLEAMVLVGKPQADLTTQESRLVRNLGALLKGGIPVDLYVENRAAILDISKVRAAAKGGRSTTTDAPPPAPPSPAAPPSAGPAAPATPAPPPARTFCLDCGTKLTPGVVFCTGCGKRLA